MKFKIVETMVCKGIESHNSEVCKVVNEEGLAGIHITTIINGGNYITTIYYSKKYGG